MCKVLIMTGVRNKERSLEFIKAMAPKMSKTNDDGIGYTAIDTNGHGWVEKWLNNDQFFNTDQVMTPEFAKLVPEEVQKRLPAGSLMTTYLSRSDRNFENLATITMHTRFGTVGGVNITNTHPFLYKGVSLIHNGGISNHKELKLNKVSTCDSEAALQAYLKMNVINNIGNTQKWIDMLEGRWAFGIIGTTKKDVVIVDIVRSGSMLYKAEIEELGIVYSTSDNDIKESVKELSLTMPVDPTLVPDNMFIRYNAMTGALITEMKLEESALNLKKWRPANNTYRGHGYYSEYDNYEDGFGYNSTSRQKTLPASTTSEEPKGASTSTTNNPITAKDTANRLAPYLEQQPEYPSVFKSENGVTIFDDKKVIAFCQDQNEQLDIRLAVWDDRMGTDLVEVFDDLSHHEQIMIEELDYSYDFFKVKTFLQVYSKSTRSSEVFNLIYKQQVEKGNATKVVG